MGPCLEGKFNPYLGCQFKAKPVDDNNDCTVDFCDAQGIIQHIKIEGCCNNATECHDGNDGTVDKCTNNICSHTPRAGFCTRNRECDDKNKCTTDICDSGACIHKVIDLCCECDIECEDYDQCTVNTCDISTNTCQISLVDNCCHDDEDCGMSPDPCQQNVCQNQTGTPSCNFISNGQCCTNDDCCNDDNICTLDTCGANKKCSNDNIFNCCRDRSDCLADTDFTEYKCGHEDDHVNACYTRAKPKQACDNDCGGWVLFENDQVNHRLRKAAK
eukprot:gene4966-5775_t